MAKFATQEGTEKFFRFHEVHPDKKRSFDDLSISGLSLGTYLGESDDKTDQFYANAISLAINHGINAIDTSINYRNQRSEKVIGRVLKELSKIGVTRDQLIISTKGGLIPGAHGDEHVDSYIRSHYVEKGVVKLDEIIQDCHCIAPKFLSAEIDHSLKNLELDCIDLYYLHNPEIQLMALTDNEFDEKMYHAFELLEEKVQEGKIRRYGLATWNGFRQKSGTKGLLDLSKLLLFAENIAGPNHHFRAIQVPLNFIMLEAIKTGNQEDLDEKNTILHFAKKKKMNVMISSPLMQSHIFRLPGRIFESLPENTTHALKALQFITSHEHIASAIVGMKNPDHIHENVKVLSQKNWSDDEIKRANKVLGI